MLHTFYRQACMLLRIYLSDISIFTRAAWVRRHESFLERSRLTGTFEAQVRRVSIPCDFLGATVRPLIYRNFILLSTTVRVQVLFMLLQLKVFHWAIENH